MKMKIFIFCLIICTAISSLRKKSKTKNDFINTMIMRGKGPQIVDFYNQINYHSEVFRNYVSNLEKYPMPKTKVFDGDELENIIMNIKLSEETFIHRDIRSDGNCLFRSALAAVGKNEELHGILRLVVADRLRERIDVNPIDVPNEMTLEDMIYLESGGKNQHITELRKLKTYGTGIELEMIAQMWGVWIAVYFKEDERWMVTRHDQTTKPRTIIYLQYSRNLVVDPNITLNSVDYQCSSNKAHYSALFKLDQDHIEDPIYYGEEPDEKEGNLLEVAFIGNNVEIQKDGVEVKIYDVLFPFSFVDKYVSCYDFKKNTKKKVGYFGIVTLDLNNEVAFEFILKPKVDPSTLFTEICKLDDFDAKILKLKGKKKLKQVSNHLDSHINSDRKIYYKKIQDQYDDIYDED
jgi:hypothetical protein